MRSTTVTLSPLVLVFQNLQELLFHLTPQHEMLWLLAQMRKFLPSKEEGHRGGGQTHCHIKMTYPVSTWEKDPDAVCGYKIDLEKENRTKKLLKKRMKKLARHGISRIAASCLMSVLK